MLYNLYACPCEKKNQVDHYLDEHYYTVCKLIRLHTFCIQFLLAFYHNDQLFHYQSLYYVLDHLFLLKTVILLI